MLATNTAAFLPASTLHSSTLLRRPRTNLCTCFPRPSLHVRPHPIMQAPAPPPVPSSSNASPPTPINLVPSEGFALRDATIYRFVDLCVSPTALQRPGAYAIRGPSGVVQYMGYSKNIASKLFLHQRLLPHACLSFQVYVPSVPTELMSPELLESVLEYWVAEIGSVPDGNTVDRHLWENNNPDHRKPPAQPQRDAEDVPIRERTTPRRVPSPRATASEIPTDPFSTSFRSAPGSDDRQSRPRASEGWAASDDDFVEVDVDPLDPFSATRKRRTTRTSWDSSDMFTDENSEDWLPIMGLVGVAGCIWFLSFLGNALPAATPSLGM